MINDSSQDRRDAVAPDGPVITTVSGGVRTVVLNRPHVHNALNEAMRSDLWQTMSDAAADPATRVVVITGAGGKAFCAGADVGEFRAPDSLIHSRESRQRASWIDAVASCPRPVIAAIDGYCLGGGLEVALACDIRIATTRSVFGLPEVSLGIIPGAGGTQRLSRVVGLSQALFLTLTASRIDAAQAARINLVAVLCEPADFTEKLKELSMRLCENAPVALSYAKEAVRRGFDLDLRDGLQLESDLATLLESSDDRLEGLSAYRERRSPRYLGS